MLIIQPDKYQEKIIKEKNNLIVIAGPGSGKTTTIINKVNFLLSECDEKDILLLSFTNKSVNDIKEKLYKDIEVLTFHKLAINILKHYNYPYKIINDSFLPYIIDEYFHTSDNKKICRYLNINKLDFNSNEYISLKKLIITFINLFKTNNKNINDLKDMVNTHKDKLLIKIILDIFLLYEEEKKSINALDFDDIIIKATSLLKDNYTFKKYKYIIIDEFQDASHIRLNLIKQIYNSSDSIITVFGDDAQSIFRFSGCDVNIFLNFNKYFPNSKKMILINTYRNSQELINISEKFINKNKCQIKKNMKSNMHIKKPIVIKKYLNEKKILKKVLDSISSDNIMILSRNKKDIYKYLDKDITYDNGYVFYKNKKYKYLTVHSSKGLESDYVIVLNMEDSLYGFPNKLESHSILKYATNDINEIPYAEERRLFFVAITRCKYQTILLVPRTNPSIFIKEIKR